MSEQLDDVARVNRHAWNSIRRHRDTGVVPTHHAIAVDILAGKSDLSTEQRRLAGNVVGKRLLDLGCGDGYELLEWAQAGAHVVGIDNSPAQIAAARRAMETLGLRCELVVGDVLHLPDDLLQGQFDIVFSAWVTSWIGHLDHWFRNVFLALKPGGVFLLSGAHPLTMFFSEMREDNPYRNTYFAEGPFTHQLNTSDAWNPGDTALQTIEWSYMLGTIVTAIARSGLRIAEMREIGDASRKYGMDGYPLEFIVQARKE